MGNRLPKGVAIYGLGENDQRSYRHDLNTWLTWVGWAREQVRAYEGNIYSQYLQTYLLCIPKKCCEKKFIKVEFIFCL